jgi:uncharacterized RDD family membrane protein YckC
MDIPDYELVLPDENVMKTTAPLTTRMMAYVIDILIASAVFLLPFTAAFMFTMGIQTADPVVLEDFLYDNVFILVVFDVSTFFVLLFYFGVFEKMNGQTLGKKFMKIKVEPEIGYGSAFIRNLSKASIFSMLTIPFLSYVLFLDFLWILFGGERLLSKLTKTKVLYEPKLSEGLEWTQEL